MTNNLTSSYEKTKLPDNKRQQNVIEIQKLSEYGATFTTLILLAPNMTNLTYLLTQIKTRENNHKNHFLKFLRKIVRKI